jgi:hypothetical protein
VVVLVHIHQAGKVVLTGGQAVQGVVRQEYLEAQSLQEEQAILRQLHLHKEIKAVTLRLQEVALYMVAAAVVGLALLAVMETEEQLALAGMELHLQFLAHL